MTAYLALHELKPNQVVTAPAYRPSNPAEITLGLDAGERIRVRDLLYALLLPSASDAAETLAVAVSGSVPAFVADMNRTARKLGLSDTSYANPIGLDDPDNYSSAHDLVTLASILMRNPALRADREHPQRDAPQRRPSADGHQPEHAAGPRILDQRRQDRAHPRRGLRAGRLRDEGLDHPALGRARHFE